MTRSSALNFIALPGGRALVAIGVLILPLGAIMLLISSITPFVRHPSNCSDFVVASVESPGNRWTAQIIDRNCHATTPIETVVHLVDNSDEMATQLLRIAHLPSDVSLT